MNEIQKKMANLGWRFSPIGDHAWSNGSEYEKKDGVANPNFERDYALAISRLKNANTEQVK